MKHAKAKKLTQEDLVRLLVEGCGMRLMFEHDGAVTLQMRVNLYSLPSPKNGEFYIWDEIQHILDIWYDECPDSVKIQFRNGKFKEV